MSRAFTKDFKTYDEQIAILESRNLPPRDRERCLNALKNYGYYRLSAYWYPFRIREEDHVEGIDVPDEKVFPGYTFDDIIDCYEFDRELRHVLSRALELIEVSIRVAIAYHMGQYERFAFENIGLFSENCSSPSHWDPEVTQFEALQQILSRRQTDSKEVFVQHFEKRYDGRLPVWAAIETWDFGSLNACFQLLRTEDRIGISEALGVAGSRTLGSWIGPFRVVRNMCAHHSRLNRRHFTDTPRIPGGSEYRHVREIDAPQKHRLYPILVTMVTLLRYSGREFELVNGIHDLANKVDNVPALNLHDYGFPENWENEPMWSVPRRHQQADTPHSRRRVPLEAFKRMFGSLRG